MATSYLYRYFQDYGRMGSIEGLFFLTDKELKKYSGANLAWDELLGKFSEGRFDFSGNTLTKIDLPEGVPEMLEGLLGKVVSGPFDFDYFDEQIEEQRDDD